MGWYALLGYSLFRQTAIYSVESESSIGVTA
jgi:hypothetical protein